MSAISANELLGAQPEQTHATGDGGVFEGRGRLNAFDARLRIEDVKFTWYLRCLYMFPLFDVSIQRRDVTFRN